MLESNGRSESDTFAFDSDGYLVLLKSIDHEAKERHSLTLEAYNPCDNVGTLSPNQQATLCQSTTRDITIVVRDANEMPKYNTFIEPAILPEENDPNAIGQTAGTVVFDNGDGGQDGLRYSISDPAGFFEINPDTGELIVIAQLDRENQCGHKSWNGKHAVTVTATDQCSPEHIETDANCVGLSASHEVKVNMARVRKNYSFIG